MQMMVLKYKKPAHSQCKVYTMSIACSTLGAYRVQFLAGHDRAVEKQE